LKIDELNSNELASALLNVGFSHESDLYLLLLNLNPCATLKFSERLLNTALIASKLRSLALTSEIEILEPYDHYYVKHNKKKGGVQVYDEWESLVYSCPDCEFSGNGLRFHSEEFVNLRSHLININAIQEFDILVL